MQIEPEEVRMARQVVEAWENDQTERRYNRAINAHYDALDKLETFAETGQYKEICAADVLIYGSWDEAACQNETMTQLLNALMDKLRSRIAVLEAKTGGKS